MKKIIALMLALVLCLITAACAAPAQQSSSGSSSDPADGSSGSSASGEKLSIGIIQIEDHPSLDEIRGAFLEEMAALGYDDSRVDYDYQCAQGDPSNASTICQKFVGDGVDMIVAIATPSAQAAAAATSEIPIIFSAVTDPVTAELVEDMQAPGGNCTGTSDAIPVDRIFALAKELTPDVSTYGLIYNLSEPNSVSVITEVKEYLESQQMQYVEATIANVGELTTAAESLIGRVDALFSPIDNTVAKGMVTAAEIAIDNGLPYYVAADSMVADGGLATVGVNYTDLGHQTAQMAADVLSGKSTPAEMPVQILDEFSTDVNEQTAQALGLDVSAYLE